MARVWDTKKKKNPRATELSQLKKNYSASPSCLNPASESSLRLQSNRRQRAIS